mmetsp:Transcript_2891/g.5077  ORF Transcript_2891/g.5077 Transcript_2891/m.5077 type:complete len:91 (-) Transcript_2891:362-634(-)
MEKKELVSSSKVKAVPFVLGIRSAESVPVDVFALASLFFGVLVFLLRVSVSSILRSDPFLRFPYSSESSNQSRDSEKPMIGVLRFETNRN